MQWHSINLPPDIQKKHHAIASCSIATQPMNAAYKQPKYGLIIACPLTDGYNKLNGILLADIRKNQDIDSIRVLPPNHMFTGVNEQGIAYTSEVNDDWMAVGVSAFDKTGKQQWHYPLTKSPSNIIMNPLPGGKLVIAYHFYPPNQR
ncbi:MAG TPA: hypothetical protein PKC68_05490, partial [Alphaproteobacteria bacterium]|nr:hypothetical protein [Alphaproteobacteria bacterium]